MKIRHISLGVLVLLAPLGCQRNEPPQVQPSATVSEPGTPNSAPGQSSQSQETASTEGTRPSNQGIPPVTAQYEGKVNDGHYEIVIRTAPFEASRHVVTRSGYDTKVDGRYAIGTDQTLPQEEIVEFLFRWDNADIEVPPRFWSDCYHPFNGNATDRIVVRKGPDPNSVYLLLGGSDAAGTYGAIWILRKNGKHERLVSNEEDPVNDLLDAIDGDESFDLGLWKDADVVK